MKVVDLLESRRANWQELERHCARLASTGRKSLRPADIGRFSELYRAACADLALADAYQLPPNMVQYLHHLVGRAHNQLYRSRTFRFESWAYEMLYAVPQRLFRDNCFRLAFVIFWGLFVASMAMAYSSPDFAERTMGKEQLEFFQQMYEEPVYAHASERGGAGGFYVRHNAGIGLQCFAMGLVFGVLGLLTLVSNAVILGAVFGFMATTDSRGNFFNFVTAHAPFELTAVVLAAAAGMRLGFSLVDTGGWSRAASLRRAGREAVPTVMAAVILFILAALIEGFISPTSLPYFVKAAVAIISSGLLMFYFVMLGYPREAAPSGNDNRAPGEHRATG